MKPQSTEEVIIENDFRTIFNGKFYGVLRWHQLDDIWNIVKNDAEAGWYCYKVDKTPPQSLTQGEEMVVLLDNVDKKLRNTHAEDYCGVVYVDDLDQPSFIKVFNPKGLGTSCSIATSGPLPEWVICKTLPQDISDDETSAVKTAKFKKRWLGNLFSK